MDKNSFLSSKQFSKGNLALICLLLMFVGFLGARVAASIGMFLFGVNALRDIPPRRWLEARWWLLGLSWILLIVLSLFITSNKEEWGAHFQDKLPFLLLPLAFHFLPPFSARQLRIFTWMLLLLMTSGAMYSLSFFLRDPVAMLRGYSYSHILPTPAYDDHISFSMAVALTIGWTMYRWPSLQRGAERLLTALLLAFLVLYLHVLAAKSGLIALYVLAAGQIIYLFVSGKWKAGLVVIISSFLLLTVAYKYVPTFHNRIVYSLFTARLYQTGERTGRYGDVSRIISYDLALKLIMQHPLTGVGAGDVMDEMNLAYDKWYPQVTPEQRLWPHNQFLTFAVAGGIPLMLLFTGWIIAPFSLVKRNRDGFYFTITWLVLLVPLMIDPFLEVQWGVFVYLFFLLWHRFQLKSAMPEADSLKLPI